MKTTTKTHPPLRCGVCDRAHRQITRWPRWTARPEWEGKLVCERCFAPDATTCDATRRIGQRFGGKAAKRA